MSTRHRLPDYMAEQPTRSVLAGLGLRQSDPVHVLLVFAYRLAARLERREEPWDAETTGSRHVTVTRPAGGLLVELSARIIDPADEEPEQ